MIAPAPPPGAITRRTVASAKTQRRKGRREAIAVDPRLIIAGTANPIAGQASCLPLEDPKKQARSLLDDGP